MSQKQFDFEGYVQAAFEKAYAVLEDDATYQSNFGSEGSRKAQYIIDDLKIRETNGQACTATLGYVSIGGADGSEIAWVLRETNISRGILIEISDDGAQRARETAESLKASGKILHVLQGDATARLPDALSLLEKWRSSCGINGVVYSAQGVLHELPQRSPGFSLPIFIGSLFKGEGWQVRAFYSREPGLPEGWPEQVQIMVPGLSGASLARFAQFVSERLSIKGKVSELSGNWVAMPSLLAVETLHKLIRRDKIARLNYELGEQLTKFDPLLLKKILEDVPHMEVDVSRVATTGFIQALRQCSVRYRGLSLESLPVPRTHAEIIGFSSEFNGQNPPPTYVSVTGVSASTLVGNVETSNQEYVATLDALTSQEVDDIFGRELNFDDVQIWLSQFKSNERPSVERVIRKFRYFGRRDFPRLCRDLHRKLDAQQEDDDPREFRFVSIGGPAKSGALVAYYFRKANKICQTSFVEQAALHEMDMSKYHLVFLDDIVATGHQAVRVWSDLVARGALMPSTRATLATWIGTPLGVRTVESRSSFRTCVAELVDEDENPFNAGASDFTHHEERQTAKAIVEAYGRRLFPRSPMGFLGGGMLVGFSYGTPDSAPPIFWSENNGWRPLLEAGGSTRLMAAQRSLGTSNQE